MGMANDVLPQLLFSLSPLRPHLYLCLMWNLVKRNRCASVRVCVALGVIRPFGSWHFSAGEGGPNKPPSPARRASMSSCLQGVRPMLSFSLFSCVYFRFRTRFSNRLNTWQATATATKHTHTHTHTQFGVCLCVSHSHMAPAGTVDRMPFWPSNSKRCGVNRNHLQLHRPLPVEITRLSSSSSSSSSPSLSLSFYSLLELLPPLHIFLFLIIFN